MTTTEQARRSFWAWGSEAQEPSAADRAVNAMPIEKAQEAGLSYNKQ